jgi:hypothetical protein
MPKARKSRLREYQALRPDFSWPVKIVMLIYFASYPADKSKLVAA